MKRLKLGKIQWISLLVVSAMFANLCSHMVLAAASEQTKAKVTTTATKKQQKQNRKNTKHSGFLIMITILIVRQTKKEMQKHFVHILQRL